MMSHSAQPRTVVISVTAAFGVAAFASLAVWLWPKLVPKREPSGLESLRVELQETRRDLASMKRTQALLATQKLVELGASPQVTPKSESVRTVDVAAATPENERFPEHVDEETLQQVLAEQDAATVVRHQRLANDLASEPRDAAWANETEGAYRTQIERFEGPLTGAKPSLVSLECRSSLCRVELAFSSQDDAQEYGPQLARAPGIKRGTWRHINMGGGVRTVAFVARGDRTIYPLQANQNPSLAEQ